MPGAAVPGFFVFLKGGICVKKKKSKLIELTKETPEARKLRVSSGERVRAVVFEDRRGKLRDKAELEE